MGMKLRPSSGIKRRAAGMTLFEVLIASTISLGVIAGILTLMLEVSKEERREMVDVALSQKMALIQDQVTRLIRSMSERESVAFGDAFVESGGYTVYRRIVVAKGESSTYPREELAYMPADKKLVYDPDRKINGNEQTLFQSASPVFLEKMYFYPSLKPGGIPDSSTLNVCIEMDDGNASGRKNPDGTLRKAKIVRTFTVKMRNL
jgi:hypothetical protein